LRVWTGLMRVAWTLAWCAAVCAGTYFSLNIMRTPMRSPSANSSKARQLWPQSQGPVKPQGKARVARNARKPDSVRRQFAGMMAELKVALWEQGGQSGATPALMVRSAIGLRRVEPLGRGLESVAHLEFSNDTASDRIRRAQFCTGRIC
jgi:hypothetical protein